MSKTKKNEEINLSLSDDIIEKIKQYNEETEDRLKEMKKFLQDNLGTLTESLFAELPEEIKKFSWTQYTPYFNDGDTCVFTVYSDYPTINGDADYEYSFTDPESKKEAKLICNKISKFIQSIESFLEELFGDHAEITIYRNGKIKVTGYDHE